MGKLLTIRRSIMLILKLLMKVLLLPIMLVLFVLVKIGVELSSFVLGGLMLVVFGCIIYAITRQMWPFHRYSYCDGSLPGHGLLWSGADPGITGNGAGKPLLTYDVLI